VNTRSTLLFVGIKYSVKERMLNVNTYTGKTADVLHKYCFVIDSVKQCVLVQLSVANLLYTMHYLNMS